MLNLINNKLNKILFLSLFLFLISCAGAPCYLPAGQSYSDEFIRLNSYSKIGVWDRKNRDLVSSGLKRQNDSQSNALFDKEVFVISNVALEIQRKKVVPYAEVEKIILQLFREDRLQVIIFRIAFNSSDDCTAYLGLTSQILGKIYDFNYLKKKVLEML